MTIPACADRARRERLEQDDVAWLMWYFAPESGTKDPFTYEFVDQQREMIAAIGQVFRFGGDVCRAATRGEGKTIIAERLDMKYTLQGAIAFSVIFCATGTLAGNLLDEIKAELESNDRLAADYPEVCCCIRALESTPNRAHYMLAQGHRHDNGEPFGPVSIKFQWCGQQVKMPKVPGSPSSAAIIATRGLDSAVRGLRIDGRRPAVALIDDPDRPETCDSDEQAGKLEDNIESGISMLGTQQRAIARVMLCTIKNRRCVAYKFSDPQQKPTWKGKRFRFLLNPPANPELWQDYIEQRRIDLQSGDEFGRRAHQFYLDNRAAMDDGAAVANPNRFDDRILPDGSAMEVSALQRYYNEVVRIGPAAVASELDNDPPDTSGAVAVNLPAMRVQRQLSGHPQGDVPPGVELLTCGIDVGKWVLHWQVVGWGDSGIYSIDYGEHKTTGAVFASEQGLDLVVYRAVLMLLEQLRGKVYVRVDGGERMPIRMTLVDASYQTDAVYGACKDADKFGERVMPIMGIGSNYGAAGSPFRQQKIRPDIRPFDGGRVRQLGKIWLVESDADRWKRFCIDRMLTTPGEPGCFYLWGQPGEPGGRLSADERKHADIAAQLTNEPEVEQMVNGRLVRKFIPKGPQHQFDTFCYTATGAALEGFRLPITATAKAIAPERIPGQRPPEESPPSLADLAKLAAGR